MNELQRRIQKETGFSFLYEKSKGLWMFCKGLERKLFKIDFKNKTYKKLGE